MVEMNPKETKILNSTKYFDTFQLFVLVFGSLSPHSLTQFSDAKIFHYRSIKIPFYATVRELSNYPVNIF